MSIFHLTQSLCWYLWPHSCVNVVCVREKRLSESKMHKCSAVNTTGQNSFLVGGDIKRHRTATTSRILLTLTSHFMWGSKLFTQLRLSKYSLWTCATWIMQQCFLPQLIKREWQWIIDAPLDASTCINQHLFCVSTPERSFLLNLLLCYDTQIHIKHWARIRKDLKGDLPED